MRASGTPHNRAYAPFSARTGSSGIVYAFEGTFLDAVLRMRFTHEAGDAAADPFTTRSETYSFLRVASAFGDPRLETDEKRDEWIV